MNDIKQKLENIQDSMQSTEEKDEKSIKKEPMIDKLGRAYATGKRKNSVSRIWIKKGKGNIIINGKSYEKYFSRPVLKMIINQPFKVTNTENVFDIMATVKGGGISGQAGAIKHGISKAIINFNPELRRELKLFGFLTRDSRIVERKKPGMKKARKKFQFSKR